jgi:hypothetical protein
MHRHWQVRRQMLATADGARRWDRAYSLILGWGLPEVQASSMGTGATSRAAQELPHEDGSLRACLDGASSPGQTTDQQLERLRTQLRAQGVALDTSAIFRDDGHSGATLNRPGLGRLRDAVRAGEVGQVLITDPDRLSRNYVQMMVLLQELERFGCSSGPVQNTGQVTRQPVVPGINPKR